VSRGTAPGQQRKNQRFPITKYKASAETKKKSGNGMLGFTLPIFG